MAEQPGFEPGLTESESAVLPQPRRPRRLTLIFGVASVSAGTTGPGTGLADIGAATPSGVAIAGAAATVGRAGSGAAAAAGGDQ
jgi:hypothetical protein